eukprot:383926-Prymnesium_polylepis.1
MPPVAWRHRRGRILPAWRAAAGVWSSAAQRSLCRPRPAATPCVAARAVRRRMRIPLDFTFDGDDGEQFCLRLSAPRAAAQPHAAGQQQQQQPAAVPAELLSSFAELAGLESPATHAKAAQLLGQWLSLPTTESLFQL